MKTIPLYQVDAFATEVFKGNPAAVCPTDAWLNDATMLALAAENNLSETAFVIPDATGVADYGLRWFTPVKEMDLCGHATLATAWVLFNERGQAGDTVTFTTRSGILTVHNRADGALTMDFPVSKIMPAPHPEELAHALGCPALEFWRAKTGKNLAVLDTADRVAHLQVNLRAVLALGGDGLIVTAPGEGGLDFVSRYFAPHVGIPEDPVTGSAHTVLAPYWAKRLGKTEFQARQVSSRGGDLHCAIDGERVKISGRAVLYMKGEARLP
jgi:PhzF family phenazine biosynthesis protein